MRKSFPKCDQHNIIFIDYTFERLIRLMTIRLSDAFVRITREETDRG